MIRLVKLVALVQCSIETGRRWYFGWLMYEPTTSHIPNKNPVIVPIIAPLALVTENKQPSKNRPRIGPLKAPGRLKLS